MPRRAAPAVLAIALLSALAGCAPTVSASPAPDADDPRCAAVTVRLPDRLGDLAKRETDAQATGAWGDPVEVLLTCGVRVPGASTLPCVRIDGVDWLRDERSGSLDVYTTYGRDPAVDVAIRSTTVSGATVLDGLADAVGRTGTTGRVCR